MALRPKHIYKRLNAARLDNVSLRVYLKDMLDAYHVVRLEHDQWMKGESPAKLTAVSQAFIDCLSRIFLVSPKALSMVNSPRPHSRDSQGRVRGELYGSCASYGNIRIYLLTASRGKPTAFKTFFNTLVHEWVHHYDFEALGDTIHCSGFYQRVATVYNTCIESEEISCRRNQAD
ncbi:MAG: hypothetical protein ABIK28_02955 [Planctomycetota bacterium]